MLVINCGYTAVDRKETAVDNIFGKRYIGMRGQPAWHALGITKPEGVELTAVEAIKEAGIDFEYVKAPIGYTLPDGTFIHGADRVMVLRAPVEDDPEWAELGIVSSDYQFLQNVELAEGLDALARETGWKFETAGALGKGGLVFMSLRTGSRSVFGDDFDTFVIVSDGKASGKALTVTAANVRVVCQNTLLAAEQAALSQFKIAHDAEVAGEYKFWLDLVGFLQKSQDTTFAKLERLASTKITDEAAAAIIAAAYPLPDKNQRQLQAEAIMDLADLSDETRATAAEKLDLGTRHHEYWTRHAIGRREAAFSIYEAIGRGEEQGIKLGRKLTKKTVDQIASTPYAAVQAVSELVDWGGRSSAKAAGAGSLFGDGAKTKARAMEAAGAYAEAA